MKTYLLTLFTVTPLLLTPARAAEAPSPGVDERLERLERELKAVRDENQELRRELGITATRTNALVVKTADKANEVKFGGFIQADGEFGDPGDARLTGEGGYDRFYVRRARLHVYGTFLEHFNFRLQGDFAGAFSAQTSVRAQLTDGWINWNRYDFANLKAGQFFPLFGWEKRLDPTKLQAVEFSYAGDRLLPDRQLGVQLTGAVLDRRVGYAVGVFNGNNVNNDYNDNDNFMVVPRVEGVPFRGTWMGKDASWTVGLAAYYSDDTRLVGGPPEFNLPGTNYFAGLRLGLGLDTQFRWGPLEVWGEYLVTRFEPSNGNEYTASGWYLLAGYTFLPKWQGIVRYDEYDPTDAVDGNKTRTWTFGLNYRIKGDTLKLMGDYLLIDVPNISDLQQRIDFRLQAEF